MLQFSAGTLLLFLLWFGPPVTGEIGVNFSKCLKFFYENTPPRGFRKVEYQPICQRYKDQYRFASLYHRHHRASLYSAYILSPADGKRPIPTWMYEPQLVFRKNSPEMLPFPVPNSTYNRVRRSQAVPEDYKKSGYTRGHLSPSMHHKTMADRKASFTLTNIVPQHEISNKYTWNALEKELTERFKAFCKGPMYMITGVLPYTPEPRLINKRVSVPEYMWSAYCCPIYSHRLPESMKPFYPTYAAVGRNDPSSGENIVPVDPRADARVRGYDVKRMSLETLEGILRTRLNMPVSLFEKQCLTK